jgi:hypothetical protein
MENRTIAILAAILAVISSFFILSGCSVLLPPAPMVEQQGDVQTVSDQPAQSAQPQPAPQPAPAEATAATPETASAETRNITEPELNTSGSLKLQDNLELCPHLALTISCDKYDLRGCDLRSMGSNAFNPDVLNCRDGQASKREDTQHKFCLIQDCEPLTKDSIVYGYGGSTAYAEYSYVKESVSGGIMLHYTLLRCGEQKMEFADINKCRYYRTSSGMFD